MLSFHLERLWKTLGVKERNQLLAVAPFQGAINLGESVVAGYIAQLKAISGFENLQYEEFRSVCRKLIGYGLAKRVEVFPDTELLQWTPGVGQWLRRRLETDWKEPSIRALYRAYIIYYRGLADQLHSMWLYTSKEERSENLTFLGYEYDNLLGALAAGLRLGDFYFTHVFLVLETYWSATRQDRERLRISRRLIERLEGIPEEQWDNYYRYSRVHAIDSVAAALLQLKDYSGAIAAYREGLGEYRALGLDTEYPEAERSFYQNIASSYGFLGDWEESNANYERAFAIARRYDDQEGIADYHLNIGKNKLNLQRYEEARAHFESAVVHFTEMQQADWLGIALGYLGFTAMREGDYEQAAEQFNRALLLFEALDDKMRLANILRDYSLMQMGRHLYQEAMDYARRAMELYIPLGNREQEGLIYLVLFGSSIGKQEWEEAFDYLKRATFLFRTLGDEEREAMCVGFGELVDAHLEGDRLSAGMADIIRRIADGVG